MLSGSIKSEVYHRFKAAEKLAKFCTGYDVSRERKKKITNELSNLIKLWACVLYSLVYNFQDVLSFQLKRPLRSCDTLGCDHTHPWAQNHLPLWQLLQDSLSSLCMHPSPPTSTPWPLSMKLVLLGFTCPDQMETTSFPNTFGLSLTDEVRTFSGRYLWLVWFLFTLSFWVSSPLQEAFFFPVLYHPCNSASLYLQYVCVLTWPCQASAHWCFSELSLQPKVHTAPPTSNCLYPLQRKTRLRQLSSNSTEAWIRACLWVFPFKDHDLNVCL